MSRSKTPSFITELPLKVSPHERKILFRRFEAARQVYNACLGEALKRLALLRQSKAYQAARAMSRGRERTLTFRDAEAAIGFREYDLYGWSKQFNHSWLDQHLGSQTVKALTTRAYKAVRRWQLGIDRQKGDKPDKGKPHFKRKGEITCVDNITNLQGLRWHDDKVVWKGLELEAIISDDPVTQYGLSHRVKHIRLVHKRENGQDRFYAQLVCEGLPYQHVSLGNGTVGLDMGPSTVGVVAEDDALLVQFCAELQNISVEMRRLQRKIDRQRRANNPDNYNEDGTAKKGVKHWCKSKRQGATEAELAEAQRKQAAYRKSLHGQLVNHILGMGDDFKTEALSCKSWQKRKKSKKGTKKGYGSSIQMRAPGTFIALLTRKAEAANGSMEKFSTYNTKLSQRCHNCGATVKKPLSQRWHICNCGIIMQRDLYSGFLAECTHDGVFNEHLAKERWLDAKVGMWTALIRVAKNGRRLPSSFGINQGCREALIELGDLPQYLYPAFFTELEKAVMLNADQWSSAGPLLQTALSNIQPTNAGPLPQSFGIGQSQSRSSAKVDTMMGKTQDVVPFGRELGRTHRDIDNPNVGQHAL